MQIKRLLIGACGLYLSILLLLMVLEPRLVYPAPKGGDSLARNFGAIEMRTQSSDGTNLHGWYFAHENARHTIVFFHGNAESVETSGAWVGRIAKTMHANVLIFDYRGYGIRAHLR